MKHLSNIYDPRMPNARLYVARRTRQSQQEAWREHQEWLAGKVIGDPQATEKYTVSQLKDMGMVGVYEIE